MWKIKNKVDVTGQKTYLKLLQIFKIDQRLKKNKTNSSDNFFYGRGF